MLISIQPEPSDPQINEMVKESRDLISDVGMRVVQIMKADQLAVADLHLVVEVADGARGVEVAGVEGHRRVVP